jgi:hypothetical protein
VVSVVASTLLTAGFSVLPLVLTGALIAAVAWAARHGGYLPRERRRFVMRAALSLGVWLGLTASLSLSGWLRFEGTPARPLMVFLLGFVLAYRLATGPLGTLLSTSLPWSVLIGFQGFRVIVEWLLSHAHCERLIPVEMSMQGWNLDVVTGASALFLAALSLHVTLPRWLIACWNVMGLLLLLNVVVISVLSAPTPLRVFEDGPANVWVERFPFVWLPTVLVSGALFGHTLIFRRLRFEDTEALERRIAPSFPRDKRAQSD